MEPTRSQLAWRCRRGMLELDLLLQGFLQHGYAGLSTDQQGLFVELLEWADQDLQAALVEAKPPREGRFAHVIEQIRQSATA